MSRCRSTIIVLIASAVLGTHLWGSHGTALSSAPARARAGLFACAGSSIGWVTSCRPSRRATTLSQFVPWKNRVKSVIEGRVHEIVDECDLGPAIVPERLISSASVALEKPCVFKVTPLRC